MARILDMLKLLSYVVDKISNCKISWVLPSVDKTRQWISEAKLLHAHQSLTDLENSRDDLLYELHRLPNHSLQDKQMLKV